jgi:hypothetical protein
MSQPAALAIGRATLAVCRAAYERWANRADADLTTYLDQPSSHSPLDLLLRHVMIVSIDVVRTATAVDVPTCRDGDDAHGNLVDSVEPKITASQRRPATSSPPLDGYGRS